MNLNHFVCAILQMALLSSDFRSIGFFVKSTAILYRQAVLPIFHLKCCENAKILKLVDGWVFRVGTVFFFQIFSDAGGFADAEDPVYPRCPAPAKSLQ